MCHRIIFDCPGCGRETQGPIAACHIADRSRQRCTFSPIKYHSKPCPDCTSDRRRPTSPRPRPHRSTDRRNPFSGTGLPTTTLDLPHPTRRSRNPFSGDGIPSDFPTVRHGSHDRGRDRVRSTQEPYDYDDYGIFDEDVGHLDTIDNNDEEDIIDNRDSPIVIKQEPLDSPSPPRRALTPTPRRRAGHYSPVTPMPEPVLPALSRGFRPPAWVTADDDDGRYHDNDRDRGHESPMTLDTPEEEGGGADEDDYYTSDDISVDWTIGSSSLPSDRPTPQSNADVSDLEL